LTIPPPSDIPPTARDLWDALAADLCIIRRGHPTVTDRELLANAVTAQQRLRQVGQQLDDDGPVAVGSTGQPVPHPLLAVEAQLRKEVEERLSTLGLISAGRPGMEYGGRLTAVATHQVEQDVNPLLFVVQRARDEAEQRRILERALAEASPMDKLTKGPATTPGDRMGLRGTPIITRGVSGTMPGTDPLGALLS
jgi:P27 family predicted phage terminase small subunit